MPRMRLTLNLAKLEISRRRLLFLANITLATRRHPHDTLTARFDIWPLLYRDNTSGKAGVMASLNKRWPPLAQTLCAHQYSEYVCGSVILKNFLMAKKQESKEANFVHFGAYKHMWQNFPFRSKKARCTHHGEYNKSLWGGMALLLERKVFIFTLNDLGSFFTSAIRLDV